MKNLFKEFKEFAAKGNVIDLAVAVVVGVAFNAVVDSFVKDVVMQLIAALFKQPDFSKIVLSYHGVTYVLIGNFINQLLNFLIVTLSVFVTVKFLSTLTKKKQQQPETAVKA
ncbi:MAG: large conductance mechanosensitive channel protein MscL [bacterium]